MAKDGWEIWKVMTAGGELEWLGLTRPGARAVIDREKVWTLVPKLRVFIANWFITEDFVHQEGPWVYENVEPARRAPLSVTFPTLLLKTSGESLGRNRC
ncbi:hypothetical protein [Mycolicibacter sinensis]|uniref:Uncharacterized protein n=1 Tax=Mycolicibacter sinensis (strain JDM601) TaxID=875328 RepID=A0A1A2EQ40_MYCSD|nr:hypothetical protein [Mycolicibacter sinensis]OBG06230.1 hypothetical protein A5771_08710 [Mycolicibacter sinensis]OBG07042.1 hypothetical protein A5772_20430 [Mycolicibacter sinensis]